MTPEEFAEQMLNDLNEKFDSDSDYIAALEELIDRAQTMLDAKNEEIDKDSEA